MDVFQPSSFSSGQGNGPNSAPNTDPRVQSDPDYGTLGPGSDVAPCLEAPGLDAASTRVPRNFSGAWRGPVSALAIGILLAILTFNVGHARAAWSHFTQMFSAPDSPASPSAEDVRQLDHLKPQKQAETLLELAVGRSDGAVDEISSRMNRWQGKLKWDSQIATLTTAALNSNDMRVRESGVEIELAAYGLAKNSASLNYLLRTAESTDHAQKIWALWALGLIANRGVETERVVQVLTAHLKDSDEEGRRWAVEGLALTGANKAIPALLIAMHGDPAAGVRERAACSLAESGMFSSEQRLSAMPQLLNYSDDPTLDAQTHAWAFQALADITGQRLPNDSTAWRDWYANAQN
jgi:hypothetical protein